MGIRTNIVAIGANPPVGMNLIQGTSNTWHKGVIFDANKIQDIDDRLDTRITDVHNELDTKIDNTADRLQQLINNMSTYEVSVTVGSFSDLSKYDKTTLNDGDIIKVQSDETNNGSTAYYRWDAKTDTYQMLGADGMYYTKSETDQLIDGVKQDVFGLATQVTNIEQNIETNKAYVQQGSEILTIPN